MDDIESIDLLNPPSLYDHKFDIDDIIIALCNDEHEGRILLSTRNGKIIKEELNNSSNINDGDDNNHWHVIQPLPSIYISELAKTAGVLKDLSKVHQILDKLDDEVHGEWIYEELKKEALEWLDERNLIPPSMQHVRNIGIPSKKSLKKIKVKIIS